MSTIREEITTIDVDDGDSMLVQHGDNDRADARRRLEARLEEMRLKRELDELW